MSKTRHKITATQSGTVNGTDWEAEYEITFDYRPAARPILYPVDRADPGYSAEVEFMSIKPGAGDHGAFTDLAQSALEDWARDYLDGDGYDAACEVAEADRQADEDDARERRDALRREDAR